MTLGCGLRRGPPVAPAWRDLAEAVSATLGTSPTSEVADLPNVAYGAVGSPNVGKIADPRGS